MALNNYEKKRMDELNFFPNNYITGNEILLIQSKEKNETYQISLSALISGIVSYIRGESISIAETDPTVPDFVKSITKEDIERWNTVKELRDDVNYLMYPTIKILSFVCEPNVSECGEIVENVLLKWRTNGKPITSIMINGISLTNTNVDKTTIQGPFEDTTKFTLEITDDGGYTNIETVNLEFVNGIYHGSANMQEITSDFIKSLDCTMTNTRTIGFTTLSREGQYIYVAYPARLGGSFFMIQNEYVDFEFIQSIDFVNNHNYVEPYYVYRSKNTNLGQTIVYIV